jgi:hypothetical protein
MKTRQSVHVQYTRDGPKNRTSIKQTIVPLRYTGAGDVTKRGDPITSDAQRPAWIENQRVDVELAGSFKGRQKALVNLTVRLVHNDL